MCNGGELFADRVRVSTVHGGSRFVGCESVTYAPCMLEKLETPTAPSIFYSWLVTTLRMQTARKAMLL